MAANKLNVLHWHMSDTESWPFQSTTFPELSKKGAHCDECIYTRGDVKRVITEAALLGIRVIVEFDVPGHSQGK
jgi:hexosaminidase